MRSEKEMEEVLALQALSWFDDLWKHNCFSFNSSTSTANDGPC